MMVRLFNAYYPRRVLALLAVDAIVVVVSLLCGVLANYGSDAHLVMVSGHGFRKVLAITGLALLLFHYFDLYEPEQLHVNSDTCFRLLAAIGVLSLFLSATGYVVPKATLGRRSLLIALFFMAVAFVLWRVTFSFLSRLSSLKERVYILGTGRAADEVVRSIAERPDLGIEVVGWSDTLAVARPTADPTRKHGGRTRTLDRVIVALPDRRGALPVQALLELKMRGVRVQDATEVLEKNSGKIGVDGLYPSWLIFSDGFNTGLFLQRVVSAVASLILLILSLPLLPLVILVIKILSPGPVLYRQARVGNNGNIFTCFKFRTMNKDAEADTGPTWARDDDPRITSIGRILRMTRIDELPQLWNVLRGDMAFVGPRPERPEFVEWLKKEIPYYYLRNTVPPGITGWAQVRYRYGNSVADAKEKLQYDLYYIKHRSLTLDLLIMFRTIKTILLARGSSPCRQPVDRIVPAKASPAGVENRALVPELTQSKKAS